jgi:hypothetical protein
VDDSAALTVAIAIACGAVVASGCRTVLRRPPGNDYGVQRCSAAAGADLLSVDALQCWFSARHGRWRTLNRESHFDVLVVQVEASDVRDAEEIARRFVAQKRGEFTEILLYVHPERALGSAQQRRVQWTLDGGFSVLDFPESTT